MQYQFHPSFWLLQQSPPSNLHASVLKWSSQYPSPGAPGAFSVGQAPGFGVGPAGGEGVGPAGGALTPTQAFGAAAIFKKTL